MYLCTYICVAVWIMIVNSYVFTEIMLWTNKSFIQNVYVAMCVAKINCKYKFQLRCPSQFDP